VPDSTPSVSAASPSAHATRTTGPAIPVGFVQGLLAAAQLGEAGRSMLEVALALVDAGWRVFPCHQLEKRPLIQNGFYSRSNSRDQVERWWGGQFPSATVGIVPGDGGLIALDVDSPEALAAVQTAGLLPAGLLQALGTSAIGGQYGLIAETGGSSEPFEFLNVRVPPLHLYLRVPDGTPPTAIPGDLCRFDNGYVIAPGFIARRRYRIYSRRTQLAFKQIAG